MGVFDGLASSTSSAAYVTAGSYAIVKFDFKMAARTETERLLEEYSSLQRMIASHRAENLVAPVFPSKRRRITVDDEKKLTLMKEYSKLRSLIDRHKQGNSSRRFSTSKKTISLHSMPHNTSLNTGNMNGNHFPATKTTHFTASTTRFHNATRFVVRRQHIRPNLTLKNSPVSIPSTSKINSTPTAKKDTTPFRNPIPSTSKMHYNAVKKVTSPLKSIQSSPVSIASTSKMHYSGAKKETTPLRSPYKLVRSAKTKPSISSTPRVKFRSSKYALKYVSQRSASRIKAGYLNNWSPKTKRKHFPRLMKIEGVNYKSSRNKLLKSDFDTPKSTNRHVTRSRSRVGTPVNGVIKKKRQIVTIKGVKFSMAAGGKSLRRMSTSSDTIDSANRSTPNVDKVSIGGVTYYETQPGMLTPSLYHRRVRSMANRVLNRSINHLTTAKRKSKQYCLFFNKFGTCTKHQKGTCPFIHDSSKIAVCKRFLHGGCNQENCHFSHELCVSKMPVCNFFLHGRCRTDTCPYLHVNVNPEAGVCEDFQKGYCPNGQSCKKWHVTAERKVATVKRKRKRSVVRPKEPQQQSGNENSDIGGENSTGLPTFIPLNDSTSDVTIPPKTENKVRIQPEFLLNSCGVRNN